MAQQPTPRKLVTCSACQHFEPSREGSPQWGIGTCTESKRVNPFPHDPVYDHLMPVNIEIWETKRSAYLWDQGNLNPVCYPHSPKKCDHFRPR